MRKNNFKKIALNFFSNTFSLLLIVALWETGAKLHLLKTTYFPPPSTVILRFFHLLQDPKSSFVTDIYASFYRYAIATLASIPPAIILGLCIGLNKYISRFFNPLIAVTYPIPKLAILPLLLLLFGIDDTAKIIIIVIGLFYAVLLNTILGIKRLASSEFLDIVTIYKIPRRKKIFRIFIRGALPEILTGIKLGMGYGLVMIVGSEFTASKDGIGLFMWNAWDQFRPVDLYCGLYVLSLTGIIIFFMLDKIINNLKELKGPSSL